MSSQIKPLTGIKVIDLTRMLAGPYCTMLLGDLGADIVKVESPGDGDPIRTQGPPFFHGSGLTYFATNRNKNSCVIDLQNQYGKEIILSLVKKADVIVENFRPGVMNRLGLQYEELRLLNPKLIYASLSGYGADGPDSLKGAFDLTIQAVGGYMSITGERGGAPVKLGTSAFDIVTGMNGYSAILAALLHRNLTGEGQKIETSLLEGEVAFLGNVAMEYLMAGSIPNKWGSEHPQVVPYKAFKTLDGWVVIGAGIQNLYEGFMRAIEREDLINDSRFSTLSKRNENRDALYEILDKLVSSVRTEDIIKKLEIEKVPCAPVNNIKDVFDNQQVKHRKMRLDLNHPEYGDVPTLGSAVKFSNFEITDNWSAPPLLGEDTKFILKKWLNLTDSEISAYQKHKAFG